MPRLVGIVALFVFAACNQTSAVNTASPSPVIAQGNWSQNLTLSGDVNGHITTIVPDNGTQQSLCSGANARDGDNWSDTFFANVDASGNVWQLTFVIQNFRGPGGYADGNVVVLLQSPDNTQAWQSRSADKVAFTMERNQQAGTIDATLTSAASGAAAAEHITGAWNCRG